MLWYFLEWSIKVARPSIFVATPSIFESLILQQISLCFKSVITHALHIDKTLLRYHFLGDRNKCHWTMTSQQFQFLIEFLPLSSFSSEMLYPTYTLVACLLLREVPQKSITRISRHLILEFLQKGIKLCINCRLNLMQTNRQIELERWSK